MSTQIRAYLHEQRAKLNDEIRLLMQRIEVVDLMLSELDGPKPIAISKPDAGVKTKPKLGRPPKLGGTTKLVKEALDRAGDEGITSRELASAANLPIGTISSRLAVMKNEGLLKHIQPRYFAIHSDKEDNNIEQGGERAS